MRVVLSKGPTVLTSLDDGRCCAIDAANAVGDHEDDVLWRVGAFSVIDEGVVGTAGLGAVCGRRKVVELNSETAAAGAGERAYAQAAILEDRACAERLSLWDLYSVNG